MAIENERLDLPRDAAWEERIQLRQNVEAALAITVWRGEFDNWPEGFKAVATPSHLVAGWTNRQDVVRKLRTEASFPPQALWSRQSQRQTFLDSTPSLRTVPANHILVAARYGHSSQLVVQAFLPNGSGGEIPSRVSFLDLYALLGAVTCDEALERLAKVFTAKGTSSWLETEFADCWEFASQHGSRERGYEVLYRHPVDYPILVRRYLKEGGKALVATTAVSPKAPPGTARTAKAPIVYAPVLPKPVPLLRPSLPRLERRGLAGECLPPVMLTNSIELAVQEEYKAARLESFASEWVSWWGGEELLEETDFTPLENRAVLYVLARHSARTDAEVCRTARGICEALPPTCNVRFKSRLGPVPVLMEPEEFQQLAHWLINCGGGAPEAKAVAAPLFFPLLRNRNVTVISGSRNPVTWLALSVAASLRGAQSAFAPELGWRAMGTASVLYCWTTRQKAIDINSALVRIHRGYVLNDPLFQLRPGNSVANLTATDTGYLLAFLENAVVECWNRGPVNAQAGPILIVLDGVLSLAGADSGRKRECFQKLMENFAARNWAAIICTSKFRSSKNLARYLERTGIDCIVELEEAVHPTQPQLLVTADVFHSAASDQPNQSARLLFSRDDRFPMWSPCMLPPPMADRERRIRKLAAMGYGPKEIRGILTSGGDAVSYANVRKIMQRLGLTKKRKAAASDPWHYTGAGGDAETSA